MSAMGGLPRKLEGFSLETFKALDVENIFDPRERSIKRELIQIIAQYLHDEGYSASSAIILDESNVKIYVDRERTNIKRRIKKALLEGEWNEVDTLCKKHLKNCGSFLYEVYKEQYLEYIENQQSQKAYVHINKRLKPLEHLFPTPGEFKDLCYLLTAKSVHDVPRFKSWQGISAEREALSNKLSLMMDNETLSEDSMIPPKRLLTLIKQSILYQILTCRNSPSPIVIDTLLTDYSPKIIPNVVKSAFKQEDKVKCISFSGPNKQYLVSGSGDASVSIWDLNSEKDSFALGYHKARIWDVASTALFAASASADSTVKIWDIKKRKCLSTYSQSKSDVYALRFGPEQRHLVAGGYDKVVRLYNLETGAMVKAFFGHSAAVTHAVFNSIGNIIVTCSKDANVKFWDVLSGVCIKDIPHFAEVTSAEFSLDGVNLLTSSKDNCNRIWDLRIASPIMKLKGHTNISKNFIKACFMGSKLVCGGSESGNAYIWDAQNGKIIQKLPCCDTAVYRAIWNPNMSILATCSDTAIKTWVQDENIKDTNTVLKT